ncbi:MAG: S1 RNA-binding domain-containing protein [bacterium]|jgi:S1 RNA binding domain protein|nr:S1 RNA-binding domain-containing protein [bacterium]MDD3805413.1 S1 RNA-binding domain-containing protein [bacterium]MDD4152168.1 S1 RNA-binding domain-containing protein [bacterium]MDD4557684.1 S1 RNA-binding domain-containing protein [bacterium]
MPVTLGEIVEGSISKLTNFGFFVELPGGESGLVHISEAADTYVRDVRELFKENDRVTVRVIAIDERGKIELSVRKALPRAERQVQQAPSRRKSVSAGSGSGFEDLLGNFMKKSEERLLELKRNTESKRGGRSRRR